MHDSLEDVPDYEYENLEQDCSKRVADIVRGVTEIKSLPYRERKMDYLENLKTGMCESVMVSVADKLHNLKSLSDLKDNKKYNTDFMQGQILLYREVLKISKDRLKNKNGEDHPLVLELEKELNKNTF
jgi:(p)ppGpp synthase/HD superfamily hydrolase